MKEYHRDSQNQQQRMSPFRQHSQGLHSSSYVKTSWRRLVHRISPLPILALCSAFCPLLVPSSFYHVFPIPLLKLVCKYSIDTRILSIAPSIYSVVLFIFPISCPASHARCFMHPLHRSFHVHLCTLPHSPDRGFLPDPLSLVAFCDL